jgi:two-component system phosphate regulon response regulator PhoB
MAACKILIVDDEETLCEVLKLNLEAEGYEADTACSAEDALKLHLSQYSLILLDIMMGEMNGIQFARLLKSKADTKHIPIIFCTAKDTEDDMVLGLNLGADDYIMKPYTIRNVVTRVRTVLRRCAGAARHADESHTIVYNTMVVDKKSKRCTIDGVEIKLRKKEFEILVLLLEHRERIFSREEILAKVWPNEVIVLDRVIDVNITRLRQAIGEYGKQIITRSGYGYGFMDK